MLGGINSVKLPTGYTKLEYIESDGNHYIDTGFVPNQDTRVKMSILASGLSGETYAYGARNSAGSNAFLCALEPSAITFGYAIQYRAYEGVIDGRYDIDQNKNIMTVNGTELSGNYVESFSSESNLTLFGRNTAGSVEKLSAIKLYSCKIYDNGTLVRDFIPAMNASGEAGLYDLVNNVFYAFKQAMTFTWSIVSGSWTKGTQSSAVDGVKYTSVSPGANGSTRLRCTFSGVTSITFNCVYNGESNYDYLTVGSIDTACTRDSYGTTLKGTSGTAKDITFSCTTASHYVEFCYSKDSSVDNSPDCAVVYIKSAN